MQGLFKLKPPADPKVTSRLKRSAGTLVGLSEQDTIRLAELACRDDGCSNLETVIIVIRTDRHRFEPRFPGAMAEVTEAGVQSLPQHGASNLSP